MHSVNEPWNAMECAAALMAAMEDPRNTMECWKQYYSLGKSMVPEWAETMEDYGTPSGPLWPPW